MSRGEKWWDDWFLGLVDYVSTASKDPSTKVGAVITRPDHTVASIGYNGFPRGMSDNASLYADRETKYSRIVHGEMNAILNAHGPVDGFTLYVPMLCCDRCAVHVIQAGIKRVVCREPSADMVSRWGKAFEATRLMFAEARVEVVEYPAMPLVLPCAGDTEPHLSIRVAATTTEGIQCYSNHLVDGFLLDAIGVNISDPDAVSDLVSRVTAAASQAAVARP